MNLLGKNIVGINFNDYAAQVVELKVSGEKIYLQAYNRKLLPLDLVKNGEILNQEGLKNFLNDLLREANPKTIAAKELAIVFPSSKVFTHIFRFPVSLKKEEINKTLLSEVENIIPFSLREVYFDFTVLESEDSLIKGASHIVLFAAIAKNIADKYMELFQSMGLTPSLFGIGIESLKYGLIKQLETGKNNILIDVNTLHVNYLLMQDGVIKHFLSSNKGGKYLITALGKKFQIPEKTLIQQKEQNNWDKRLFPEINNFIENNYKLAKTVIEEFDKKASLKNIDNIYLTGEFLNLPDFYTLAQKHFPKNNVIIGDPRKYLDIDVAKFRPPQESTDASYYSTYFINAVGIGLRGLLAESDEGINLLPDSLKKNLHNKRKTLFIAIGSILTSIISLSIAGFIFFTYQNLSYARLNLEIQKSAIDQILYGVRYQEIRNEIVRFNNEVAELTEIENSLFSLPIMLENITKLVPKEITLTGMQFNDENLTVGLTGIAADRENLLSMTKNFKDSNLVSKVITPISTYDEKYNISFEVQLQLIFKELPQYGTTNNN